MFQGESIGLMTSRMKDGSARKVTVVDYDSTWPSQFERLRDRVLRALSGVAVTIEHVGSTSVPGLAAKPIIDIDVIVASASDVAVVIERLSAISYAHRGNLGIEGREAFESPPGLPTHHLYVCVQGNLAVRNHLLIRDYLRGNAEAVIAYGLLKRQLAEQFPTDMTRYISGKTDFLLSILRDCGFSERELEAVADANLSADERSSP